MKFGMRRSPHDARHLRLSRYVLPGLPDPPPFADWGGKVPAWGMLGNDAIGDCVIAAAGHAEMVWTSNAVALFTPPDAGIVHAYSQITGYIAGDELTDNGTDPTAMLKYWRDFGICGHAIGAWAMLDAGQQIQFKRAISMFECVLISLELPENFDFDWGRWCDTSADPDSEKGHEVLGVAYSPMGVDVVTWGRRVQVSWDFLARYAVEAEAVFSEDILVRQASAPTGFDRQTLISDLERMAE